MNNRHPPFRGLLPFLVVLVFLLFPTAQGEGSHPVFTDILSCRSVHSAIESIKRTLSNLTVTTSSAAGVTMSVRHYAPILADHPVHVGTGGVGCASALAKSLSVFRVAKGAQAMASCSFTVSDESPASGVADSRESQLNSKAEVSLTNSESRMLLFGLGMILLGGALRHRRSRAHRT